MSNCYFKTTATNIPGNELKYECGHGHVFYISLTKMSELASNGKKDFIKNLREVKRVERDRCRASRNED